MIMPSIRASLDEGQVHPHVRGHPLGCQTGENLVSDFGADLAGVGELLLRGEVGQVLLLQEVVEQELQQWELRHLLHHQQSL